MTQAGRGVAFKDFLAGLWRERLGVLVCFAAFVSAIIRIGLMQSVGVILAQLKVEFGSSLYDLGMVGYIAISFTFTFTFVPAMVIRKYGSTSKLWMYFFGTLLQILSCVLSSLVPQPAWMFLTHSLVFGVGSVLSNLPVLLFVTDHFPHGHKYHVNALNVDNLGYSLGVTIFSSLLAWLIQTWSWQTSLRVSALIFAVLELPLTLVFYFGNKRKRKKEETTLRTDFEIVDYEAIATSEETSKEKIVEEDFERISFSQFWKNIYEESKLRPEIYFFCSGWFFLSIGYYMPFLVLPYYTRIKTGGETDDSEAVAMLSIGEFSVYLVVFIIGNKFEGYLIYINSISSFNIALLCFLWTFVDVNMKAVLAMSFLYGLLLGFTICYIYVTCEEVTEMDLDKASTLMLLCLGLGAFFTPFFIGAIYDIRNSFRDLFISGGSIMLASAILFSISIVIKVGRRYKKSQKFSLKFGKEHVHE